MAADELAQRAWESKKEQLAEAISFLLLQLQSEGFVRLSLGSFIGALSLESMLSASQIGWLPERPRALIQAYAKGLIGFDPAAKTQSERVLEQHEWMRFEIAKAALVELGAAEGSVSEWEVERLARCLDWSRVPKSAAERLALGERELLEGAVGLGARRERGGL